MNFFELTAYAAPAAQAQPQSAGSMISAFLPFVIILGVMYFLMIRPQKKKEKLKQEMLSQLIVGDKILTIGGITGVIVEVSEDGRYFTIETGTENMKSYIKFDRVAFHSIVVHEEPVEEAFTEEATEETAE